MAIDLACLVLSLAEGSLATLVLLVIFLLAISKACNLRSASTYFTYFVLRSSHCQGRSVDEGSLGVSTQLKAI